jgi:sialate O-acetylesterase
VAIGLINASWGGTRVEPWTPPVGFESVPALSDIHAKIEARSPKNPAYRQAASAYLKAVEQWLAQAKAAQAQGKQLQPLPGMPATLAGPKKLNHQEPLMLYNGMVHALVGYTIRGAIWYQGESNHGEGALYTEKKKALIGGWRKIWGIGDFPFYFVQIAPFKYGNSNPSILARFWEAQEQVTEVVPNTGMVVTNDIATINDIHPPNKQDVGKRLALLALKNDYGKNVVASGPTFERLEPKGKELRVVFANAEGLKSRDGKALTHFEVAGKGTGYQKATARIDGNAVVLSAAAVPEPLVMRYAWHKTAQPNLCNGAGLPTGAFRAGEIPRTDFLATVADAKGYRLVYDLDLDKARANVAYNVDDSARAGTYSRVAYLLELSGDAGEQYVYVSMDAFTKDATKLGVPTVASKALFQQAVQNLMIASNVKGIATGAGITGNVEFWPSNYATGNSANVPGASATLYDFGDQHTGAIAGYGSMQIHNPGAKQTLFAINNWRGGLETGIGNSQGKTRDWTFTGNGGSYEYKRLRVLVK